MLHYASDSEIDFVHLFDKKFERTFIDNNHYQHAGGDRQPGWGETTLLPKEVN